MQDFFFVKAATTKKRIKNLEWAVAQEELERSLAGIKLQCGSV
jgi:hypothetical protein